jgi:predicted enzyme related to lactoylglutathione lyase
MNQGIKTVLYPVKDLQKAKTLFTNLLGVEPHVEYPVYIGFAIGDQEIGLIPYGQQPGLTAYYHVDDIRRDLQLLEDSGAQVLQPVQEVGGGRSVASVKDIDGNILGLIQDADIRAGRSQ